MTTSPTRSCPVDFGEEVEVTAVGDVNFGVPDGDVGADMRHQISENQFFTTSPPDAATLILKRMVMSPSSSLLFLVRKMVIFALTRDARFKKKPSVHSREPEFFLGKDTVIPT